MPIQTRRPNALANNLGWTTLGNGSLADDSDGTGFASSDNTTGTVTRTVLHTVSAFSIPAGAKIGAVRVRARLFADIGNVNRNVQVRPGLQTAAGVREFIVNGITTAAPATATGPWWATQADGSPWTAASLGSTLRTHVQAIHQNAAA
jgi:hypothetical protein